MFRAKIIAVTKIKKIAFYEALWKVTPKPMHYGKQFSHFKQKTDTATVPVNLII